MEINDLSIFEINAIIADFDGLKSRHIPVFGIPGKSQIVFEVPNCYPFCQMHDPENTGSIEATADQLDYHTRFDWLIPVVKKIKAIDPMSDVIPTYHFDTFHVLVNRLNKALNRLEIGEIYSCVSRIIVFLNSIKRLAA